MIIKRNIGKFLGFSLLKVSLGYYLWNCKTEF